MDLTRLRDVLRPHIVALKDEGTHYVLPTICEKLGLPAPDSEGSRREKMSTSFDALSDAELPRVAERFLHLHPPAPNVRNEIQDLLWADVGSPEIPKRFRREVARALAVEDMYLDTQRFNALLDRLWVLDDDPLAFLGGVDRSLRAAIHQHVHRNPGDWSVEHLLELVPRNDS
jgi:hypothetical protein